MRKKHYCFHVEEILKGIFSERKILLSKTQRLDEIVFGIQH